MSNKEIKIENVITIDGKDVPFHNERNLLEVIRKAGFVLPTLCYRSDLSIYGACRMCVVEIEGRGVQASCTVAPIPGMNVKIQTEKTRRIRKVALELLLANHDRECTSCQKSGKCDLQKIARNLGIDEIRFQNKEKSWPVDSDNPSIIRDPNKCILCGACVRMCREVQGKSVLDFTFRGANTMVSPAYGKKLSEVDCTFCGQCVAVCPTGALRIKSDVEKVWSLVMNPQKLVIAQVAPAVRVALCEAFGIPVSENGIGLIAATLRKIGFDKVFDTTFTADLTILEEAHELLDRFQKKDRIPLFTSCCPAWVRLVEQKYPQFIQNLSSCKSPQQMFGALVKKIYVEKEDRKREDLAVISIMPCTAKKSEARRSEFVQEGLPDVDVVLTTQELICMIEEAGIQLRSLTPESLDSPFGMYSGAGILFGNSGGVAEAAARTAYEILTGDKEVLHIEETRGLDTLKEITLTMKEDQVKIAVVNTLNEAADLLERILKNEVAYDFVEVMACPGGCIAGAGQPPSYDNNALKQKRMKGLYHIDQKAEFRKSHENPEIKQVYHEWLGQPGSKIAHSLLHTKYQSRKRIEGKSIHWNSLNNEGQKIEVCVCVGTTCYLRGAYDFMSELIQKIQKYELGHLVEVKATFCLEKCGNAPNISIDGEIISNVVPERLDEIWEQYIWNKINKEI